MQIEFFRPWILILIPVFIAFLIYTAKKLKVHKYRKRLFLIIRSLLITFLILALSGASFVWNTKDVSTVFLVDASDSTKNYKKGVEEFITQAMKDKKSKDLVGVMSFGENVLVDNFISKKTSFSGFGTEPKGTYTNIEGAITNALSLMGDSSKKRIVLITDGKENEGKSSKLIPTLRDQNVDLKVYKIGEDNNKNEVAVENLDVPQNVRMGQEFNVIVNVNSTVKTQCKISLFSDNTKKGEQVVNVNKGNNRFVFKDKAEKGGFRTYKVSIEPDSDTQMKNNEISAFTNVKDKARILVIKDKEEDSADVIKILKASNMEFDVVGAGGEPSNIKALSKYKSIITCNVSAENLSAGFLNSLKTYVRDLAGGLVTIGGDNSFALGGYSKTPLEEVLPVDMDMKGKKEVPDMSMMLVIDRSGSMAGEKMELAKEAAVRTVDYLRPRDEMGVLAFDDAQYWVVKRQKVTDKASIKETIGTIRGGGGTSILPAVYEAYTSLKKSNAKIKHIILLTDGQAERDGYDTLVADLNKANITVSTVAVGQDSDASLLQDIAKAAKGRFYQTDQFTNIPRIFAKETFMISRTYINNKKFTPIVQSNHSIISGVYENGLPPLLGYIGASPKNTSKVILRSDEEDPILTVWQYGLGKTVAWNSDMSGKWSSEFIGWDGNLKLWQNIINWSLENYGNESMEISTKSEGSKGVIEVTDKNLTKEVEMEADIITPSMKKIKVKLYPSDMGKFVGNFDAKETGAYIIKTKEMKKGEVINAATSGMIMQYSPEYKLTAKETTLESLVKETDGKYITSAKEVFQGKLKDSHGRKEMSSIFIVLALILFLIDIALRRLNLPYEKLQKKINEVISKIKALSNRKKVSNGKNREEKSNYISNLKDVKQKSKETINERVEAENSSSLEKKQKETQNKKVKEKSSKDREDKKSLNTSELLKVKKKK